jgi:hypothetical protein
VEVVGDSHRGPLIIGGKPIFSRTTKTQMNLQIINYTQDHHSLVIGAHGPDNLSSPSGDWPHHPSDETPLRSRGTAPYLRNSASLKGWTPPQARLHLARGLDTPSSETPSRLRLLRVHRSSSHSPDQSIQCFDTTQAPGSKANPCHAGPLTPSGNYIPALFRQPSW